MSDPTSNHAQEDALRRLLEAAKLVVKAHHDGDTRTLVAAARGMDFEAKVAVGIALRRDPGPPPVPVGATLSERFAAWDADEDERIRQELYEDMRLLYPDEPDVSLAGRLKRLRVLASDLPLVPRRDR